MSNMNEINELSAKSIWTEYEVGQQYKNGIGEKGIHDQSRINERFFVGDQWHGVNAGNEKPLSSSCPWIRNETGMPSLM